MTRQPLSGLVLRQCGVGWNMYERATGMCLGFCIEWGRNDWRVFNPDVAFLVRLGRGRTRIEALRAAWPDLTPPREAVMRDSVCEGFVWIGQSMLCCDNCGWPWFLHAGDLKSASIFGGETHVVPFPEAQQAQIPDMLAAWEANALWQAERGAWRFDWNDRSKGSYAPDVERQVGKDFPYPTGPVRRP